MAEFPTITAPEREEPEFFDAGQIDNFVIGINRGVDGFHQALAEAKETLGLEEPGYADYITQQLQADQAILREAAYDDQKLKGAGAMEMAGELVPLFAVPLGGTVARAAALGAGTSAGFFHDEPDERSRLADIALGAGTGGLFRALLRGGRAKKGAEEAVREMETGQLMLPPPPTTGQKLLTDQRQLALPAPRPRPVSPQASLSQRGLSASDFQNAGPDAVRRMGIPPVSRAPQNAARTALQGRQPNTLMRANAMRKAEVMASNFARKQEMLKKVLAKTGGKAKAQVQKQLTKVTKDKMAAKAIAKSLKPKAEKVAPRADRFIEQILVDGTKADLLKEIKRLNPAAKNIAKLKKAELQTALRALVPETPAAPSTAPNIKMAERPTVDPQAQAEAAAQLQSMRAQFPGSKKQGGFAESDLVNAAGGAVAGGAIGGYASEGDPVAIAAGALLGGAGLRLAGKRLDKTTTTKQRADMRKAAADGSKYIAKVTRFQKARDFTGEAIAAVLTDGRAVADQFMGSTMTRLEMLSPRVATALKNAEFQQHFVSGQWMNKTDKLMERFKAAGLTDAQQRRFKIISLNSSAKAIRYLEAIGKRDAADAMRELQTIMDEAGTYLKGVSLGAGLRANYIPRLVTDTSKFENIVEVKNYLEKLAKQRKVSLSDFDKEVALTQVINGALRHSDDTTSFGRAAGALQKRTVKVTDDNVDAYADLHQSLNDYFESITTQVERRRFFQNMGARVDDLGPNAENIDTVAGRLRKALTKGDMTADQLDEVAQLIRMRFGPGEQAPSKFVQNFKNLTYTALLANPISAATQFGDIAISAHRNGIRNTASTVAEQILSRGRAGRGLDKDTLLGIRNAAADFASRTPTRDLLNWGLKYSGFQWVDKLGKNTFIQSAMKKNQQMSPADFKARWKGVFDPDAPPGGPTPRTDELYKKVQGFESINDKNKEDIGFMLWNELEGAQPIALSSLPERYLRHPDGRMAYMLQSFTLKMFDIMRKDVYNELRAGNYRQGTGNLAKFMGLFVAMNGSIDQAKSFMLGKDETIPDTVVNNMLKFVGANRYMISDIERGGLGQALLKLAAPPTTLIDAATDPREALKMLPVAGKVIESRIPE